MQRTYDQCAEECLNTWLAKEAAFVSNLERVDRQSRLAALQGAAGHFRIARNMPKKYDLGIGLFRFEPVLKLLDEPQLRQLTAEGLLDKVQFLRGRLAVAYGKADLLSAATKFLWLMHRDVAIIHDSQARVALATPVSDYPRFVDRWLNRYASDASEILEACRRVGLNADHVRARAGLPDVRTRALTLEPWFPKRVLDIRLWYEGDT